MAAKPRSGGPRTKAVQEISVKLWRNKVSGEDPFSIVQEGSGLVTVPPNLLDNLKLVIREKATMRLSLPKIVDELRDQQGSTLLPESDPPIYMDHFIDVVATAPLPPADFDSLVSAVLDVQEVELASPVPGRLRPGELPDYRGNQVYNRPVQVMSGKDIGGVDTDYAHQTGVGSGAGVNVYVCDFWSKDHEDLPDEIDKRMSPEEDAAEDHGTQVAGVLAAMNAPEDSGITGIAYGLDSLIIGEYWNDGEKAVVDDAATSLGPGDVFLLVSQADWGSVAVPSELDKTVRAAVAYAVGKGIVVVTLAANGGRDLGDVDGDTLTEITDPAWRIWGPESYGTNDDSGAIFVGGGNSPLAAGVDPRTWQVGTNHGWRVNCQGWADSVYTTGLDDGFGNFGGTSSASTLVAAIAASIQGAALATGNTPVSPEILRGLLANDLMGQSQVDEAGEHIGPLPNLRKLYRYLGNIYVRDSINDAAEEPQVGLLKCFSPDILVRQKANPLAPGTYMDPLSWHLPIATDEPMDPTAKHVVYVRCRNIGQFTLDAETKTYWSKASTFVHPVDWIEIGEDDTAGLAPGQHVITNPMPWEDLPDTDEYCLITTVANPMKPVIVPDAFSNILEYITWIRDNNNVALRNAKIISPAFPGEKVACTFMVRGLEKPAANPAIFTFHLTGFLPGSHKVDITFGDTLKHAGPNDWLEPEAGITPAFPPYTKTWLSDSPPFIEPVFLRGSTARRVTVEFTIDKVAQPGVYVLAASQYIWDRHLGSFNIVIEIPAVA